MSMEKYFNPMWKSYFFTILGGNSLHNSCWYKVQETKSYYRTNKYQTRESNPNLNLEHNSCFTKLCLQDRHIAPSHKLFEFLLSFIVVKKNPRRDLCSKFLAKKWSMWLSFFFSRQKLAECYLQLLPIFGSLHYLMRTKKRQV